MSDFFTFPDLPALAPATRVCIAYSGGLDSTVLLHRLAKLRVPGLRALHVHHGLQALADDWQTHCLAQCSALGVELEVLHVAVNPAHADGPEAAAREVRY
ncbi:MAG: ATP-binding protein, partial [Stenotrophobium sp.]